jgi:hypothetical protein
MGIRVRKKIGYGLKDLRVRKGKIVDPRIDYQKYRNFPESNLSDFVTWCRENREQVEAALVRQRYQRPDWDVQLLLVNAKALVETKHDPYFQATDWDSEFGLPRVFLFQPPEVERWTRHDDLIDYYEESGPNGLRRRATFLSKSNTGIHPYDGTMVRFRESPEHLRERIKELDPQLRAYGFNEDVAQGGGYNQMVGYWDNRKLPPLIKDPEVLEYFRTAWRPRIPPSIVAAVEYMGCFPDAHEEHGILNSIRPMIYVYWS